MIDETWYRRPPGFPEHVAAGGVIVRRDAGRLYFAAVGEGDQSGYILPKGHVEPGEEIEMAARREIEEEAGLTDLRLLGELGVRERLDFRKSGWKKTHYFLYLTGQSAGHPTDPHHDYRLTWLDLDGALPMFWPDQRELIDSNRERIRELVEQATG